MAREEKRIILVTGLPGSGKGIVGEVAGSMGIPVFVMGDIVRDEAKRRNIEPTAENLSRIAISLREEYGKAAIAILLSEHLKKELERFDLILVDGVRSFDEVSVFEELGYTCIIGVHASPSTRFQRIMSRRRPGDPVTWGEFVARDLVELSWGVGNVIALADYIIVNEQGLEDAKRTAKNVLEEIKSGRARCSRGRGKAYRGRGES